MIAACRTERDAWLLKLLWNTGGRVSEVIQIRVGDITNSGLRMENLKQGRPAQKHVFLHPRFLAELKEWCRGRPPHWPIIARLRDGSKPISRVMAWYIVTRAGLGADILKQKYHDVALRPLWPHSFRHGTAIHLLESGLPINAVQGQLGHSSLQSTAVYTQMTDSHRQAMIAGIEI